MKTGEIRFFNRTKGFGFISPDGETTDVFVHATGLTPGTELNENDRVSFEVENTPKGLAAVNVSLVD